MRSSQCLGGAFAQDGAGHDDPHDFVGAFKNLVHARVAHVPGAELMQHAQPYYISPAFAFVAYPNRNSVPFREFYNIPEAETVVRGTLRYQGFPEFVKALVALGWLNMEKKPWLKEGMTWAEVFQQSIGAADASERYVPLST